MPSQRWRCSGRQVASTTTGSPVMPSTRPSSSASLSASKAVQVLEDEQERSCLGLAQEEPARGLEDATLALRRIELLPRGIVDGDVEQREQRGQDRGERAVERERACRSTLRERIARAVVALLDLEVVAQQVDHRQVGRGACRRRPRRSPGPASPALVASA